MYTEQLSIWYFYTKQQQQHNIQVLKREGQTCFCSVTRGSNQVTKRCVCFWGEGGGGVIVLGTEEEAHHLLHTTPLKTD